LRDDADLYLANRFIRKHTAKALLPERYQEQAYDHVLGANEVERGPFEAACWYIVENPVRAKLCMHVRQYQFSGCVVPGYPDLNIHEPGFWDLCWKLCQRVAENIP
jgi:putative transposase